MINMTVKDQVINARNNGKTYSEIYKEFGVAKSTAQGWVNRGLSEPVGYVNESLQRDKPLKFSKSDGNIQEFLENLVPLEINRGVKDIITSLNDYAVVGSDFHFGTHDQRSIDIFLETIQELKPKTVVLNGDTMDFLAISKYSKDLKHNWSLLDERIAYQSFLADLVDVSGGAEIFETFSNHSGNSIGGRWRRYLSDRIGELGSLPDISDILSYENVFMGEFKDVVKHVDYIDLCGLIVTHGDTVRGQGGASCLGEINKWSSSVMHGHTHRSGQSSKRVPAVGNRPEVQYHGYETGCLCSLDSTYVKHANWQQGFAIVGLGVDTFSVEQVNIHNGISNISTLGKTLYV
jgi:hypothetical protein